MSSAGAAASVAQRIHAEVVLLVGWAPAILLQLAHPLVAAGVAHHSAFLARRGGRLRRLHHTLDSMLKLTFGSPDEVHATVAAINAIHDGVHGYLTEGTAAYPAGTPYSARDPALLTWVHATLVDTLPRCYQLYVGPLSAAELDQYCLESSHMAPLLGAPEDAFPRSMAELRAYMDAMLGSGRIAVTETARGIAQEILYPPAPLPARPIIAFLRLAALGMLDAGIRQAYGYPWDSDREAAFGRSSLLLRRVIRTLPPLLRHWPAARNAWGRVPAVLPSRAAREIA